MNQPVATITGAASGIGRALAVALSQRGWAIAALDWCEAGLTALAGELAAQQRRCAWAVADVTQAEALQQKVRELEQVLGPTELLIASAGIGIETSALNLRAADFARVIDVNLTGVANSVAAVLPGMLPYSASKAGVNAFMEGLRVEVRPAGLHVTTICPSWVRTPMTANLHGKLPDMLELDDAVERIIRAIEKKKAFCAFPRSTVWRLRILRLLPRSWQDAVIARMLKQMPS